MNILEDLKSQYKLGGIVQKLIFWNIGIFVFSLFFFYSFSTKNFNYPSWLGLYSDSAQFITKPWTLLTYMFLHAGFFHLLFNLLVLHFAGRLFVTYFTGRQLLGLYILGGIFAGLVFIVSYYILGINSVLVGASGAIMATLIATASYAPYMLLRMPLIGTVKLWQVAFVLLLIDMIQLPMSNTGGHLAHLGGAIFGFLYIKLLNNGTDLTKGISKIQDVVEGWFQPKKKTPFKKVHKNTTQSPTFTNPTNGKDINQKKIDDILDKISQSGYDSLSKDEKEFLFKAGK